MNCKFFIQFILTLIQYVIILIAGLDSRPSLVVMARSGYVRRNIVIAFAIVACGIVTITVLLTTTLKLPTSNPLEQTTNSPIQWYHELQPYEINIVLDYLQKNTNISLLSLENARLNGSFVHYIELKLPVKRSVLKHLYHNGSTPERSAKAAIFRGDLNPPIVEEYRLWPLPNITKIFRTRFVPYTQRPILLLEIAHFYRYIVPKFDKAIDIFLQKEYSNSLSSCKGQCIDFSFTPIPSTVAKKGRRMVWIWFNAKSPYKLHPLDFQFEADISSENPSEWTIGRVWFEDKLFDIDKFMAYYLTKKRQKISGFPRKQYTWEHLQNKPLPTSDSQNFNAQTPRYTITDNFSTVNYLKWKFHLHMSPTGGVRLLNIQFRGETIVYEMNLQEVCVIYSGSTPAAQNLNFVDGTALFGSRIAGLVEGVDCPFGASFISPTIYTVNDGGFKVQHNATCIFEHNSQVPLRRHKVSMSAKRYYNGMPDKVLVVRSILTFLSYDYIMDYIFHSNGAVEAKVFSTGSLITTTLSPNDKEFGTKLDNFTLANVHNHLFNYKVDLDILSDKNRHSVWQLRPIKVSSVWNNRSSTYHYSMEKMTRYLIETEKEAAYKYNFTKPEYLLFHADKLNKNGYPRSYRILLSGLSPKSSDDDIFKSIAWAETQLAVTSRKEIEETSSSVYALWDSIHPVVDFRRYINNESIIDKVSNYFIV